jgi:hypothetical protein
MFRREREENGWGQRTTVEFFAAYYLELKIVKPDDIVESPKSTDGIWGDNERECKKSRSIPRRQL